MLLLSVGKSLVLIIKWTKVQPN